MTTAAGGNGVDPAAIPLEAVQAAATVMLGCCEYNGRSGETWRDWEDEARAVLAAALPYVR